MRKGDLEKMSHAFVTDNRHANHPLSRTLRNFLSECKKINEKEYRPFSYLDFQQLSKNNFRQRIRRCKGYLEVVIPSHPTFYKLKGIELPGDFRRVTFKPTGGGSQLIDILESLEDQPAKIHDIKLKLNSEIHQALVEKGCTPHPRNNCIQIRHIPITDNNIVIKALVYPKTIQIDVACSYKPIVYDVGSLLYLTEILKEASMYLTTLSGIILAPVKDWVITHYHLNKDGSYEINGQDFHFTMEQISNGLIRYYSKLMPDGTKIVRLEQIQTPSIPVFKVMQKVIQQ